MSTGKIYDLKVGYSCNNNCFHCVVEPQVNAIRDNRIDKNIDQTYSEIINCINSYEFKEADHIVITGGEPTIRKEFTRILKYIVDKYPKKKISIQTNARKLKQYVEEIYNMSRNISYVIALHSTNEKIHNEITNSNIGNPFKETWESIQEIIRVYKNFKEAGRIEIVLSRLNLHDLYNTIIELYKNKITFIGISYPHLDGKYKTNCEETRKIGFSYKEYREIIPDIYEFAKAHQDLCLSFEELPKCMWRDNQDNLLKMLNNIESMDNRNDELVTVKFPDHVQEDFITIYKEMHRQSSKCSDCVYCCNCLGVWFEAIEMFGDDGFRPITKDELDLCGGE